MKTKLAKYWPTLLHVAAFLVSFLNPSVQAYASAHPGQAVGVFFVWAEVMHWIQSPRTVPGSQF